MHPIARSPAATGFVPASTPALEARGPAGATIGGGSAPVGSKPPQPAATRAGERPLSPHLQIYRWQLTSVMSILHRATGIALSAGGVLLVWWLVAAASGPEAYGAVQNFLGSWPGLVLLLGWTAALFYHLCNGIRHLVWDTGHALDLRSTYAGGWTVIAVSAILTALAWIAGIWHWAG
jgi:succinate dehydrogenase / fumarate reductase cytochrome b subunit